MSAVNSRQSPHAQSTVHTLPTKIYNEYLNGFCFCFSHQPISIIWKSLSPSLCIPNILVYIDTLFSGRHFIVERGTRNEERELYLTNVEIYFETCWIFNDKNKQHWLSIGLSFTFYHTLRVFSFLFLLLLHEIYHCYKYIKILAFTHTQTQGVVWCVVNTFHKA